MEANPLQAGLSCQLRDPTAGKHTGAKEKSTTLHMSLQGCIQRLALKLPYLPQKAVTVPPPQQGTDRVQALFQPLCCNWSGLCCQQQDPLQEQSHISHQAFKASIAAFNSCLAPVHAHCPREHRSEGGRKSIDCKDSQWFCSQGYCSTSAGTSVSG